MNTTTMIVLNATLAAGILAALAVAVRLGLRLDDSPRPETLHPSQPIPLRVALDRERRLADAA